jgi:hypothetical protein
MIINRFFKVNSKKIVIFKGNFKLKYQKFGDFVTFCKNLHTQLRSRTKKLWLRLLQKVAAPAAPALAPQH